MFHRAHADLSWVRRKKWQAGGDSRGARPRALQQRWICIQAVLGISGKLLQSTVVRAVRCQCACLQNHVSTLQIITDVIVELHLARTPA